MENKFVQEIKNIEAELLALKTGSGYTSIRPANFTSSANVYSGVYQITYGGKNEQIFSIVDCKVTSGWIGSVFPRTPSNNTQIVEVQTTHLADDGTSYITDTCPLSIISNRPVTGVQRI